MPLKEGEKRRIESKEFVFCCVGVWVSEIKSKFGDATSPASVHLYLPFALRFRSEELIAAAAAAAVQQARNFAA